MNRSLGNKSVIIMHTYLPCNGEALLKIWFKQMNTDAYTWKKSSLNVKRCNDNQRVLVFIVQCNHDFRFEKCLNVKRCNDNQRVLLFIAQCNHDFRVEKCFNVKRCSWLRSPVMIFVFRSVWRWRDVAVIKEF